MSSTGVAPRSPDACATTLDATAGEIDLLSMEERLRFVRAMRSGAASQLGAGERWRNIEGVIAFFGDHGMGMPGTWVSHVNAGVLEGIERGLAIALDDSADEFGNPSSERWVSYITRLRSDELEAKSVHDVAWSEAKEVGTDYGVALAEGVHGLQPTEVERRFLLLARLYNWAMRNRPMLDVVITYGGLVDSRLSGLRPEFVDWFISVGNADAARRGCEIAYAIAQIEPRPRALDAFGPMLSELPRLFDAYL